MRFLSLWTGEEPKEGREGEAGSLSVLNPTTGRQVQHTCQRIELKGDY